MRNRRFLLLAALLAVLAFLKFASAPSASPAPQAAPPTAVVKAESRLVTVDVVATDSHGNVVRDLKSSDFELTDGGRQQIDKFAFIDKSGVGAKSAPAGALPAGLYTNRSSIADLAMPPTVVLLDSLNTNTADLLKARKDMLKLLNSLPANTPVAVLLLGESLTVVQDFTSDPAILRAALDKAMSPAVQQGPAPEDDPNSVSLKMFEANGGQESDVIQHIEDWETEVYSNTMDVRLTTTLNALSSIANYLGSYEGRKNLVWVSESYPVALLPDRNFGTGRGVGARDYGQQSQGVANALSDAHVAVYPVDARGLDTIQFYGASDRPVITQAPRGRGAGPSVNSASADIMRETQSRQLSQDSMDEIAGATGGRTCKTTNDLSGCVESALRDSSSYYELAYSPLNIKWDGRFHAISVKTTRSGVQLAYRHGYYAQVLQKSFVSQTPQQRLQQACQDFFPSTEIPMTAQLQPSDNPNQLRYLVTVPASSITINAEGASHKVNVVEATCIYAPDGHQSEMSFSDSAQTLSDAEYQTLQSAGLRGYVEAPRAGTARVRIAIVDATTMQTGAVDIPVSRKDSTAAGSVASAPTAPPPSDASTASALPAPPTAPKATAGDTSATVHTHQPYQSSSTSITFNAESGQSSAIDWSNGKLAYEGDLPVDQTAEVLFSQYFANQYHCDAGQLVANTAGGAPPSLVLTLNDDQGRSIKINLKGDQPDYSGTISIEDSAKPFFAALRSLVHCQTTNP